MKQIETIIFEKPDKPFDIKDNKVFMYENVKKLPENEAPVEDNGEISSGDIVSGGYSCTLKEYEKDEFLGLLSSGQIELGNRTADIEDMILEMSEMVYA